MIGAYRPGRDKTGAAAPKVDGGALRHLSPALPMMVSGTGEMLTELPRATRKEVRRPDSNELDCVRFRRPQGT